MAKILLSVPHAHCRSESDKILHFCDVVAGPVAEELSKRLQAAGHEVFLHLGDVNREEMDLNRPESRGTKFRKDLEADFSKAELLLDCHCAAEGSFVYSEFGPKEIEKIKEGDRVWSCLSPKDARFGVGEYKKGKLGLAKVKKLIPQGIQDVYEIKMTGRTIRVTGNHPVAVLLKNYSLAWKRADELTISDRVIVAKHFGVCTPGFHDYPKNDVWPLPTKDLCRMIGFFLGDGCFDYTKKGCVFRVNLFETENGKFRKFYETLGEKLFGIAPYTDKRQIRFSNHETAYAFSMLGLAGLNVYTKRVPSWVFNLPEDLKKEVIIGYAEADGCILEKDIFNKTWGRVVKANRQAKVASVHRRLIEDMRMLAISCGYSVNNVSVQHSTGVINGREINSKPLYLSGIVLRDEISFDMGIAKIRKMKYLGKLPVYDLEVEGTENFVLDGVIVHNSTPRSRLNWTEDIVILKWHTEEVDNRHLTNDLAKKLIDTDLDVSITPARAQDDIVDQALHANLPAVLVEFSELSFADDPDWFITKFVDGFSRFLEGFKDLPKVDIMKESLLRLSSLMRR